ncbi:cystatin domain-containing protein [Vibrio gangliei]|uniref:cystatin domain-containing protein n=1 Tax=Vibrio gangliei TaxID=2077090 RepID=UPI000D02128D|nr:cystatin domain-containing protein [Vibrio gangliei]
MYKKILLISAAALTVTACSSNEPAQDPELKVKCESVKVIPGGWKETEVTPEARQAALLAATSLEGSHSVKEVLSVQEQVVAGKNYNVVFSIEDGTTYETKVYRNLQGQYKILSIQPKSLIDECSAPE